MPGIHLSEGSIATIMEGGLFDKPIVQILGSKRITGAGSDRYRLLVSDGIQTHSFAMLATQLNNLVDAGQLENNTVICIDKWICNVVNNSGKDSRRVLILLEVSVLKLGSDVGGKIGNPLPYTEGGITQNQQVVVEDIMVAEYEEIPVTPCQDFVSIFPKTLQSLHDIDASGYTRTKLRPNATKSFKTTAKIPRLLTHQPQGSSVSFDAQHIANDETNSSYMSNGTSTAYSTNGPPLKRKYTPRKESKTPRRAEPPREFDESHYNRKLAKTKLHYWHLKMEKMKIDMEFSKIQVALYRTKYPMLQVILDQKNPDGTDAYPSGKYCGITHHNPVTKHGKQQIPEESGKGVTYPKFDSGDDETEIVEITVS